MNTLFQNLLVKLHFTFKIINTIFSVSNICLKSTTESDTLTSKLNVNPVFYKFRWVLHSFLFEIIIIVVIIITIIIITWVDGKI
jgi:ABC-type polysaccharide/polyol phosphate export permease